MKLTFILPKRFIKSWHVKLILAFVGNDYNISILFDESYNARNSFLLRNFKKLEGLVLSRNTINLLEDVLMEDSFNKIKYTKIEAINTANSDLVINCCDPIFSEKISTQEKTTVLDAWTEFGPIANHLAGLYEIVEDAPIIKIFLRKLYHQEGEEIHKTAYFQYDTLPFKYSVKGNLNIVYSRSIILIKRAAENLRLGKKIKNKTVDTFPKSKPAFTNLTALFYRIFSNNLHRLFYKQKWALLLTDLKTDKETIEMPPSNKVWADPFGLKKDDKIYIFVEEIDANTKRGCISVIDMDQRPFEAVTIIDEPFHMSYPHTLIFEDELYLVPESCAAGNIRFYKCKKFPYEWELNHTIFEGITCTDTNIFEHNGKWWLITTISSFEGIHYHDDLFLFSADSPLAQEWVAHPQNPIQVDSKTGRNAGAIFVKEDKLYRPSQYCYKQYGYGININEITVLNESQYEETLSQRILPKKSAAYIASHTYNIVDDLLLGDAFFYQKRFNYLAKWSKKKK